MSFSFTNTHAILNSVKTCIQHLVCSAGALSIRGPLILFFMVVINNGILISWFVLLKFILCIVYQLKNAEVFQLSQPVVLSGLYLPRSVRIWRPTFSKRSFVIGQMPPD